MKNYQHKKITDYSGLWSLSPWYWLQLGNRKKPDYFSYAFKIRCNQNNAQILRTYLIPCIQERNNFISFIPYTSNSMKKSLQPESLNNNDKNSYFPPFKQTIIAQYTNTPYAAVIQHKDTLYKLSCVSSSTVYFRISKVDQRGNYSPQE